MLTTQVREEIEQLNTSHHVRIQPTSANGFCGTQVDFQEALKQGELPVQSEMLRTPSSSKMPIGRSCTAHNLSGKKYRLSINEKINYLRLIVPGSEEVARCILAVLLYIIVLYSLQSLVCLRRPLIIYITFKGK